MRPVGIGTWVAALTAVATARAADAPSPLTTAAAVRALSPDQAEQALPVRVHGVITYSGSVIFIQDETAGIFIDAPVSTKARYKVGELGDLDGYTAPGLFAPQIVPKSFTVKGMMPLPPARRSSFDELATGKMDSQRVEVAGIIRAVLPDERPDLRRTVTLKMAADDGVFPVYVRDLPAEKLRAVVDSSVRVRGVMGGVFNERRQMIGIKLYVGSSDDFVIEEPGPTDPFAVRPTPVERLLRFQPEGTNRHRVRVVGTVTLHHPGAALYVEDGTGGVSVRTSQTDALAVGDRVEVVGFPAMGDWTPYLEDAMFRRTGGVGVAVAPISVSAEHELSPGAHDSRLVSLEAELVDLVQDAGRLVLVLKSKNVLFDADLPATAEPGGPLPDFVSGARMRVQGISVVRVEAARGLPTSFRLLLRSLDDVAILERPSWFTLRRLAVILALLGAVASAAVGWVMVLRRRVREQTQVIRKQVEHEAALEARYRDLFENANDVVYTHDTAGRFLTINRAGEALTGYARAEILGKTIYELAVPERREAVRVWLERLLGGERTRPTYEGEMLAKDGRRVPVELSVRPLVAAGAQPTKIVGVEGIARDITERRRAEQEIAAANQRLVETSRRAGMAEVAAGVLHNVGNVLTSVNVSLAEIDRHLRGTKLPGLAKAVALVQEHAADLPRFLGEDARGRELPAYLSALAEHLAGERSVIAKEVEQLARAVEHIKEIVAMQQGYARVSGVRDEVEVQTLVEDALRINREALQRHKVTVVREFQPVPAVLVEKHKVLQILVNLLSNAKYACEQQHRAAGDGVASAGRITVRVETPKGERHAADRVRVVVADNGIGIPHQNLARVFEHGFTTRKEGHGFGLHSAALTAWELGGSLGVHSDGPGRGARFTLEIPVRPPERPVEGPRLTPPPRGASAGAAAGGGSVDETHRA